VVDLVHGTVQGVCPPSQPLQSLLRGKVCAKSDVADGITNAHYLVTLKNVASLFQMDIVADLDA
jgi:hypothetical protein